MDQISTPPPSAGGNPSANNGQQNKKSRFSCLQIAVALIVLFICLPILYYLYGTLFKGSYTYYDSGQPVLSLKYPKAYYISTDYNDPETQGFRLLSSFSIDYEDIMIFTIYKKDKSSNFPSAEAYLNSKDLGQCTYKQYGQNKVCISTNNPGIHLISTNDYLIHAYATTLVKQPTTNYILNSITTY